MNGVLMRKILITILLVSGIAFTSTAQTKKMAVGADLVLSVPMGNFSDYANLGFGGLGTFELAFMPQLVGTGQIGYISWGTDSDNLSVHAVPILVGAKYFFVPNVGFYGTGQLGLTVLSTTVDIPTISVPIFGISYGGSETTTDSKFSFSLGAGYELPVSPNIDLDFKALINLISDANNFQIRAGAKYTL